MNSLHSQFPFINVDSKFVCDIFHFENQKKIPFYNSSSKVLHPFDLMHLDILGSIVIPSRHGHAYFLTTIDDCSRFIGLKLMKHRREAKQHVINFINLVLTIHNNKIKNVRTDKGP